MRLVDIAEKCALIEAANTHKWIEQKSSRSGHEIPCNFPVLGRLSYQKKEYKYKKGRSILLSIYLSNDLCNKLGLTSNDRIRIHLNTTESNTFLFSKDNNHDLKRGYKLNGGCKNFLYINFIVNHLNLKDFIEDKHINLEYQIFDDEKSILIDISNLFDKTNGINSNLL